jgi:flagellar biosynthesis regulator FlbT
VDDDLWETPGLFVEGTDSGLLLTSFAVLFSREVETFLLSEVEFLPETSLLLPDDVTVPGRVEPTVPVLLSLAEPVGSAEEFISGLPGLV